MGLYRFDFSSLPVSPWRNGGGETREIASLPAGAAEFGWRASIATIAQDGPFSAFHGIDRSITLLEGDGVHLHSAGVIDHRLVDIGEPFAFSGDVALHAALLGGCSQDFNIMTRRGHWAAEVRRMTRAIAPAVKHCGVCYVLQGEWRLADGSVLAQHEGCWWLRSENPPSLVPQDQGAVALWADIWSVSNGSA